MERGEASGNSPEGAPSSFICVLRSVPSSSPEPGGDWGLRLSGASVEARCRWCEWPAAAGSWGSQQFHQHSLFWLWRYWVYHAVSLPKFVKKNKPKTNKSTNNHKIGIVTVNTDFASWANPSRLTGGKNFNSFYHFGAVYNICCIFRTHILLPAIGYILEGDYNIFVGDYIQHVCS